MLILVSLQTTVSGIGYISIHLVLLFITYKIILHNNIPFHKTVTWIKGELDTLALELSYIEQEEIAKLFLKLVRLEIAFFDACYT